MKHKDKHIHFVGIGGSGMSGIAEVLLNLGYVISGSDMADNAATRRLAGLGARVQIGHDAAFVAGADCVVTSSAVRGDNPEVTAARAARRVLATHTKGVRSGSSTSSSADYPLTQVRPIPNRQNPTRYP